MKKSFSKAEALKYGLETYKKNPVLLIAITALYIVVEFLLSEPVTEWVVSQFSLPYPTWLIDSSVLILYLAVTSFIWLGIVYILLRLVDGKSARLADLWAKSRLFWKFLVATVVYIIIVGLGFVALIIPGIYLGMKYFFYDYLVVDKELGAVEALKRSGEVSEGHKWNLLVFIIYLGIINVIVASPAIWLYVEEASLVSVWVAGIGLLVSIPVSYLAIAHVYRQLHK